MSRISVFLLLAAVFYMAYGQNVSLSGKVTDKKGKAIKGAVVRLVSVGLVDTTDADGKYQIAATGVAKPAPKILNVETISLLNSVLFFNLSKPSTVKIEFFDMRGKLLDKVINLKVSEGGYQYNLLTNNYASKMMIIRVSTVNNVSVFRYMPITKDYLTAASSVVKTFVNVSEGNLSKVQATVDTLRVTANSYVSRNVSISSYQDEVNIELDSITLGKFSFFVTSLKALQELSGSQNGFGGDFRFGKIGPGAGLKGADSICQCIAEKSMPGSKVKQWRAFLSVTADENGKQVDAVDRIGNGPWYDRLGKLLAPTLTDLINTRPLNGDPSIQNDLPNEDGIPNHRPDPSGPLVDNHHMVTGSGTNGRLYSKTATCNDWTSTTANGKPRCGFAWPRSMGGGFGGSASHWISGFDARGCAAGIHITDDFGSSGNIIGSDGGYGGFYCFALNP